MQREGSALSGVGTVFFKEMADNLTSARMRLLEVLIFVTGVGAVYATIGSVKEQIGQDPFIFLRVFTLSKDPLPSFVGFLGFLIPIVAIALGFDSVNSEFNHRTMSRLLAQPIYRDALLFGKFLAGLATLAITLTALWLFVIGLGVLLLGLPPSGEETLRGSPSCWRRSPTAAFGSRWRCCFRWCSAPPRRRRWRRCRSGCCSPSSGRCWCRWSRRSSRRPTPTT